VGLKHIATDEIVKGDINGHIKGAESQTRLTGDNKILLFMADTYSGERVYTNQTSVGIQTTANSVP
jgi:hypothetical protein